MDKISRIIKNNLYISKYKSNSKKDFHSLSYLIKGEYQKHLSQSDCIKFGVAIEKVLSEIILEFNKDIKNIKTKNKKNKSERDHLFINEKTNTVYYSELKCNLNLDTEKSKSTYLKCLKITNELKDQYPDHSVKWCLLGLRYHEKNLIENKILNKYACIKENVFGINEYFSLLNINIKYNQETYKEFINTIVKEMLKF